MKVNPVVAIVMVFLSLMASRPALAQDSTPNTNFNFITSGDEELTFIRLRRSLISKSTPSEIRRAEFAIAEYYFKQHDLVDAFRDFKKYADKYPPESSSLLAKIYLYKIANIKKDTEVANGLKKEIFGNSFVLLFSKYKVLKYKSAFQNQYEIHYYLDKIKVFLNGGNFEEITP